MKKFNYLINFKGNHDFFNRHWTWHEGLRLTLPDGFHLRSVLSEAWDVPTKYIWSITTRNMILETWSLKSEFHKSIPIDYCVETKRTEDHPSHFIWNISYYGSDDDLLLAKLSLPEWMFNPIKE